MTLGNHHHRSYRSYRSYTDLFATIVIVVFAPLLISLPCVSRAQDQSPEQDDRAQTDSLTDSFTFADASSERVNRSPAVLGPATDEPVERFMDDEYDNEYPDGVSSDRAEPSD